jgi:hypothetical protein
MKTISHLEYELFMAHSKRLILSYEHIHSRDLILVTLKDCTTETTKNRLKEYIRETYKDVFYVTTTPHANALYIRYGS